MKTSSSSVSLLLLLLLLSSIINTTTSNGKSNADDDDDQDHQQHMKPSWIKSLMSVTETAFPYTSMYFEKGRVAIKMVHDYLFRPSANIDFRSSVVEGGESGGGGGATGSEAADGGGGGVGGRVKEAASKSLEKSKSTLEESAKLAGVTLHDVTDKVKSSFKKTDEDHHSRHEL